MIVFITSSGHGYTVRSMVEKTLGAPVPDVRTIHYEKLFRSWYLPRATYVFCDFDRLLPWMQERAAHFYRLMRAAGLKCLNDPARVMLRAELLSTLEQRGINPFGVYRADTHPRPRRFPVFIRSEGGHAMPFTALYEDQETLEAALRELRDRGLPLRGLLVVERACEPYSDGLWAKWGTWRIGEQTFVEHIAVDDTWMVKTGDNAKIKGPVAEDEHAAVVTNRYGQDLSPIFDLAHVDYGRADHGRHGGRTIVFEINTNPYIGQFIPGRNPARSETQLYARKRIAQALEAIDTESGGRVWLPDWRGRRPWDWMKLRLGGVSGP